MNATGAVLVGRRTAEQAGHYKGDHHGVPIFVLSRRPPPPAVANYPLVTYVTDGIASAMASGEGGGRGPGPCWCMVLTWCSGRLRAGVLDEIQIHQIPVLLGAGRRLFDNLALADRTGDRAGDRHPAGHPHPLPHPPLSRSTNSCRRKDNTMRTLHFGLRVADLTRVTRVLHPGSAMRRSGNVPETEFGSLTMLKLPDDEFVSIELVHDPARGSVDPGGLNHLVIKVESMQATIVDLAAHGIDAETTRLPGRLRRLLDLLAHRPRWLPHRTGPMARRAPRRYDRGGHVGPGSPAIERVSRPLTHGHNRTDRGCVKASEDGIRHDQPDQDQALPDRGNACRQTHRIPTCIEKGRPGGS